MYNHLCRLSICISVAMLLLSGYPLLAKPRPKAPVIVTSQAVPKAAVNDRIPRQPVDAILDRFRLKQPPMAPQNSGAQIVRPVSVPVNSILRRSNSSQPKVRKTVVRQVLATKSVAKVVTGSNRIEASRSAKGIVNSIGSDRVNRQPINAAAIDN